MGPPAPLCWLVGDDFWRRAVSLSTPPRYLYVDVSQGTGETSPLRGSIILFLSIGESPHQVLSALEPLECRSSSVQSELLTSIGSLRPDSVSEYKWWIAIFWGSGSISSPEITKTRRLIHRV